MTVLPPTFTVIVPTYNRHIRLKECLSALSRVDYPRDRFEVVVVDDQSDVSPINVIAEFRERIRINLIVQPHGGPAKARNAGASVAIGDYLAFTDDDCAPAADWLRRLAERFAESPESAIGGRVNNRFPRNPYSTASQLLVDYLYIYFRERKGRFFTSNNLAVPTSLFRELGGFDVDMPLAAAEDREFCVRWTDHGYHLLEAPEAVVEHSHYLGFGSFCRQQFNYGRGAYYFRQIVAFRDRSSIRLEPLWFYWNLLRYPFSRETGLRSLQLSLLMVVSQAANFIGFAYERIWPCHTVMVRADRRKLGPEPQSQDSKL